MKSLRITIGLAAALAAATTFAEVPGAQGLHAGFVRPPHEAKPWTYWFWCNTLTDRETMSEELEDIARLGFGGILLTDSRGYWDDDDHVRNPPATIRWGGDEWLDLLAHGVREAARVGVRLTINVAASGGHLRGDVDVGNDSPKFLKCRRYLPGEAFEKPDIPNYRDVAVFAVRTAEPAEKSAWCDAADGFFSMEGNVGKRLSNAELNVRKALETKELKDAAEGASLGADWTIVRFGVGTASGHEQDIDVLDSAAVRRHLDRVFGRLVERVPGLVGKDRALAGLYNVSWEGLMPTWSATFEKDFARLAGYELHPLLPALAGFELPGRPQDAFMRDFRHGRGEMMREHLYGTVRAWAHERGMMAYSESGGPWGTTRNPCTFGECDQLKFLAANDFPQGEFWPLVWNRPGPVAGHANANGRFVLKGIVSTAHVYDLPRASVEAFTHMHYHWSVDPAFLKPLADQAMADGVNLFVWHTYTTSPRKYGVPGIEYFAGSHINRNVTWHGDFPAMVTYLARGQYLLTRGRPVTDVAVLVGDRAYTGWGKKENGRFRNRVSEEIPLTVPRGFAYDAVNDDALARNPGLPARYAVVHDARTAAGRTGTVDVKGLKPDVETVSDFTWCHRRDGATDIYFVAGEGRAELVFRAAAPSVEIWDPVTGGRTAADAKARDDGRTAVSLELPKGGSCFVLFTSGPAAPSASCGTCARQDVKGPWQVSFAYHPGVSARPPQSVVMETLRDWTAYGADGQAGSGELRYFSGTATYCAMVRVDDPKGAAEVCVGELPTGLARVFVNGVDCGVAWCAPWTVRIPDGTLKVGANKLEIRYTNNWHNRLVGDCFLSEGARVTRSNVHYWQRTREGGEDNPWRIRPRVYSGPAQSDALQPSGLLGPVSLVQFGQRGE